MVNNGSIYKQIEEEKYITELILEHDNIKLFGFNERTDIICDLNNYSDLQHYGQWVNSLILKWMHDDKYLLTKDNYENYIETEMDFFLSYDYESIYDQEDYEDDYYAEELFNEGFFD